MFQSKLPIFCVGVTPVTPPSGGTSRDRHPHDRHVLIGGGGGDSKTGIPNEIVCFFFLLDSGTLVKSQNGNLAGVIES